MKIGLFATWLSQASGGIENVSYHLFARLRELGYEVKALSLNISEEEKEAVDVCYAKTEKRTVPFFFYFKTYRKWHKEKPFDINIATHWGTALVAFAAKIVYGTPYVVCVYGKEIDYFKTPLHRLVIKVILKNAVAVQSCSAYTKSLCAPLGVEQKTYIIHPGIDLEITAAAPHSQFKDIDPENIRLFVVSRLVKRKGIQTTIQAVKRLLDQGVPVHYTIAGTGDYEAELRTLVQQLGIESNITFLGKVSLEQKIEELTACDLFVMPSYEIANEREIEGYGIVYIEANALGKFVIGGRSGGVVDAVKDEVTGYLVNGEKPEEIKNAILKYIQKPASERAELFEKCKQWASNKGWKDVILDVDWVIKKACKHD